MKSNKEIMINGLKKYFESFTGNYTGWDFIATDLLAKLQKLNKENVREIVKGLFYLLENKPYNQEQKNYFIEKAIRKLLETELYDTGRLNKNWHDIIDNLVSQLSKLSIPDRDGVDGELISVSELVKELGMKDFTKEEAEIIDKHIMKLIKQNTICKTGGK